MKRMVTPGDKPDADRKAIDATLGDLRHWHRLRAWCTGCKNYKGIDAEDMKARLGGEMLFGKVEKRLVCKIVSWHGR